MAIIHIKGVIITVKETAMVLRKKKKPNYRRYPSVRMSISKERMEG